MSEVRFSRPGPSQGPRSSGRRSMNRRSRGRAKNPKGKPPIDPNKLAMAEMRSSFQRGRKGQKARRSTSQLSGRGPMDEMSISGSGTLTPASTGDKARSQSVLNYKAKAFVPTFTRSQSVLNANTRSFVPVNNVAIPLQMATQNDIVYGMPPGVNAQMSPGGTFRNEGPPRFIHPTLAENQPLVYPEMTRVPQKVRTQYRQPTPPGLVLKPPKGININQAQFDGIPSPPPYHPKDGWTVYWNPPTSIKHSTHNEEYLKSLKELQSFDGITDFWKKVSKLQKPSKITHGSHNLMTFRKGLVPAWESFPHGGCWIVTYEKPQHAANDAASAANSQKINSVWQTVMFGLVSEGFGTPEVVGASLHIREKGYKVCIWNRDNRVEDARFQIADKLRMLLSIHPKQEVKYKFFSRALQDGSTTAKAVPYQFVKVTL